VKKKLYINNILRGNAILSQKLNISLKLQNYFYLLSKFKIKMIDTKIHTMFKKLISNAKKIKWNLKRLFRIVFKKTMFFKSSSVF